MINLGDEVKDTITGFKGIVVSKTEYLYGCIRVCVQPKISKDGKLSDYADFDEPQLVAIKKKKVKKGKTKTGGTHHYKPAQKKTPRSR